MEMRESDSQGKKCIKERDGDRILSWWKNI